MNHNLNLNNDAALTVRRALDDIMAAVAAARATIDGQLDAMSARVWDETYATVRANLGSIFDAQWRIDQIVFHTDPTDSEYCAADDDPSHDRSAV